ncbi:MAG TPA: thioredoxin domain-containing protein, partial [Candidatus Limnocylindrales bacterium]
PMSLFLTPDGRPFYGGTYFPPVPRHGMPAFRQVLGAVAEAWRERRGELDDAGTRIVEAIDQQLATTPATEGDVDAGLLRAALAALEAAFDSTNGGWGQAPKFPQAMAIEFLLRRALDGDADALAMARRSLDAMAAGGIHDQLGGGFHRYSTDARWLVPHFEKMLYDNALLARAYFHGWQLTGETRYVATAIDTLDWIELELTTADGGWAASEDADTDGVEGATFVWTADEVREVLGPGSPDIPLVEAAYGIAPGGNWEGRTILSRVAADEELVRRFDLTVDDVVGRLDAARARLVAARSRRPQPARDDKVLAAWNGLALAAFAEAASGLSVAADGRLRSRSDAYLAAAIRAAELLTTKMRASDGRLGRSWKDGRVSGRAVLEDHADLAEGLLALYSVTGDERWFVEARRLAIVVLDFFADPGGGFFDTASDHETLVARPKDVQDNATPSGGAMATTVLLRLAALSGETRFREAAETALRSVAGYLGRHPVGFGQWLVAADLFVRGIDEIAVTGRPTDPAVMRLAAPIRDGFRPRLVLAIGDPARSAVPLLRGRFAIDGRPTAFVCRDFACRQPVNEPEALHALLVR